MNSQQKRDVERGATLPIVATLLVAILAITALAVDGAFLFARKTELQNVADAAALACATARQTDLANCITGTNTTLFSPINPKGFTLNATVTVACPQPWQSECVQVDASSTWSTLFLRVVGQSSIETAASAIAGRNNPCLFGLATSGNTIDFQGGNSEIATVHCLIGSLSTASNSIRNSGNGTASTSVGILTKGDVQGTVSSPLTITNSTDIFTDPYAGLPVPSITSCAGNTTISTCTTVSPGCYSNLTLSPPNGCTMTVSPGLYHITSGALTLDPGNNASITGNDVNFYVVRTNGNAVITSGQGSIELTARKFGTYANILFVVPQQNVSITGRVATTLNGAIYAPTGKVTIDLNGMVATTGNIVANSIAIGNTITINDTSRLKLLY